MLKRYLFWQMLFLVLLSSACGGIDLRDDIFHGQPLWEDHELRAVLDRVASHQATVNQLNQLQVGANSLGLGNLVRQVLDKSIVVQSVTTQADSILANEMTPLPTEIAENPVVKAFVLAILEECKKARCAPQIDADAVGVTNSSTIPKKKLCACDFSRLGKALAKIAWIPDQKSVMQQNQIEQSKDGDAKKLRWIDLFRMYLWEYYTGKYVDRYGVTYQKPKVDFTITNEVIVGFANIFQDSLWDYVFLGLVRDIKAPIVYEETTTNIPATPATTTISTVPSRLTTEVTTGNQSTITTTTIPAIPANSTITTTQGTAASTTTTRAFLNGTKKIPTFAKILIEHTNNQVIKGLVERERTTPQDEGLAKRDVCIVHYASGISGDASEGLSGLIVRALGGSNLGFVAAYGKLSIGDHETLTKLIDATIETFVKRSADLMFSTILYRTATQQADLARNTPEGWKWIQKSMEIGQLLDCFTT
jgi:hypothetical protein